MAEEDFEWYARSFEELKPYKGKHIAIWQKKVIGFGETAKEAYEMAKKADPNSRPALAFIPEKEDLIL